MSALTRYTKFTPLAITYIEDLDRLIQKNLVKLLDIKPEPEVKSKNWNPAKYYEYHRAHGHDTDACWTFKNWLEGKIQAKELPIPVKKPNNNSNPLGSHEIVSHISETTFDYDPTIFITNVGEARPMVYVPYSGYDICGIWDSDDEIPDVYINDVSYAVNEASENDKDYQEVLV